MIYKSILSVPKFGDFPRGSFTRFCMCNVYTMELRIKFRVSCAKLCLHVIIFGEITFSHLCNTLFSFFHSESYAILTRSKKLAANLRDLLEVFPYLLFTFFPVYFGKPFPKMKSSHDDLIDVPLKFSDYEIGVLFEHNE